MPSFELPTKLISFSYDEQKKHEKSNKPCMLVKQAVGE
jgi:hypothetical protein